MYINERRPLVKGDDFAFKHTVR